MKLITFLFISIFLIGSLLAVNIPTTRTPKTTRDPILSTSSSSELPLNLWGLFSNYYGYNYSIVNWEVTSSVVKNYPLSYELDQVLGILSSDGSNVVIVNSDNVNLYITSVDLFTLSTSTLYSVPFNASQYDIPSSFDFDESTQTLYAIGGLSYSYILVWNFPQQTFHYTGFYGNAENGVFDEISNVYYVFVQNVTTQSLFIYVYNSQLDTPMNIYPLNFTYGYLDYIVFANDQLYAVYIGGENEFVLYQVNIISGQVTYYYTIYSVIDTDFSLISYGSYLVLGTSEGTLTILNTNDGPQTKTYYSNLEFAGEGDFQIATA